MRFFLFIGLLCFSVGCRTQPPLKKESSKTKTGFTIPANSVFSFEKGTILMSEATAAKIDSRTVTESVDTSAIGATARANALYKFYIFGGILALIGAFLLWRTHGKAGWVAIAGAIGSPLLARFYNSETAQNFALASLCIAGALFAAWHIMKKKGFIVENPKWVKDPSETASK